ncbi:DUF4116 domain-containing protein [Dysgonomonas reticulitermitis]
MEKPERNIYYFLNIELKDSGDILARLDRCGLKPVSDANDNWLPDRIGELKEIGADRTLFFISNGEIKKWFRAHENFHFEKDDNYPGGIGYLLNEVGVSVPLEEIPIVTLDDFIRQGKENVGNTIKAYLDILENSGGQPAGTFKVSELNCFSAIREEQDINMIKYGFLSKTHSRDLPDERKSEKVSLEAVKADPCNIGYVPEASLTPEIIDSIIENSRDNDTCFSKISPDKIADGQYLKAAATNASLIKYLPERLRSREVYAQAVSDNAWNLKLVPEQFRDKEMYGTAIKSISDSKRYLDYMAIRLIPDSGLVLNFLKDNGPKYGAYNIIREIDASVMNDKIAYEAVKQDIRCVGHIPENLERNISIITGISEKEIHNIRLIIRSGPGDEYCFRNLFYKDRTEAVSLAAVMKDGYNLEHVPEELRSRKIIKAALKDNVESLQFIPGEKRLTQYYTTALESDGNALAYFPESLKTPGNCLKAVTDSGDVLAFVPENRRTREICETAFRNTLGRGSMDFSILKHIPYPDLYLEAVKLPKANSRLKEILPYLNPELIDEKTAAYIVRKEPRLFASLPDKPKNQKICNIAVKADRTLLAFTPHEFITEDICRRAFSQDPGCLALIPEAARNERICCLALENSMSVKILDYFPVKAYTDKICEQVITRFPQALSRYIPEEKRTPGLCLMAVLKEPGLERSVPGSVKNAPDLNIYKFNSILSAKVMDKLDYKQVKDLYEGKEINVSKLRTENGIETNLAVRFNRKKMTLDYKPAFQNTVQRPEVKDREPFPRIRRRQG